MRFRSTLLVILALSALAFAQETKQDSSKVPPHPTASGGAAVQAVNAVPARQFAQRSKFALNVLDAAVALPQNDTQDRLRVLVSAARLANDVSPATKKVLVREGMAIEAQLISSGQKPQVSMVETGMVDCASIADLVDAIRPQSLAAAESTISAAVSQCPRQALPPAERLLADALGHGDAPAVALMSTMQAAGPKSNWTLQQFEAVFSSLPDPSEHTSVAQAPQFAMLYAEFAPNEDSASARNAAAKLLAWLGKMGDSPERVQAAGSAVEAIKKVLGDKALQEIEESDPIANQAAQLAGQPMEMPTPDEEPNVAVGSLDTSSDHSADLEDYPAPRRAREGAAYGFAAASAGNKQMAQRYFDIAFSALNELWSDRLPGMDVGGLVEEVSQAAASVDPAAALQAAERLDQPAVKAISMIAVAQAVLNRQPDSQRPKIADNQ